MDLVTVTEISTVSDYIHPPETATFTTSSCQTFLLATPGQTITLGPEAPYAAPSIKNTPTFVPTQTYTITEYDVFLEDQQGKIWTEIIIDTSPTAPPDPFSPYWPGEKVFLVPCPGWKCWSEGKKAGVIIGGVFGGILLLLLLICCLCRWNKRQFWINHGPVGENDYERWQNSHPGWGYHNGPLVNLHSGWGLRPYPAAQAGIRGGASQPANVAVQKEIPKTLEQKGARKKLGAWIAG